MFQDCHGGSKDQGSAPIKDEVDNYRLIAGLENDTHTVIEFRRALDTCDPDDYVLKVEKQLFTLLFITLANDTEGGTKTNLRRRAPHYDNGEKYEGTGPNNKDAFDGCRKTSY